MEFAIQLIIILICLFYGAKKGGIALGLLGGIGLVILEAPAAQPQIRFYRCAIRHLYADDPVRYRPRGVYDPANYLRRSYQK